MRVLVTGSHGFVGMNLIDALSTEHEIIRWDVRSDNTIPMVDAVIHLAGLAHDTKNVAKPEMYYEVNTFLTRKMYDLFLESNAKKFIFFSSIKARDCDTPYSESKRKAELYLIEKEDERIKKNKELYILRPCMIHGKGNKGNLNLLVTLFKKGIPWPMAAFDNNRSFASMGNVSFIVKELLRKEVTSGIYNVCDDDPVLMNDLIEIICDCLGKKAKLWRVPKVLVKGLAKLGDFLHLPLNTERFIKLTENCIIDNSKIKHALDVAHLPIDAKEGLKYSVKSMI